MANTNKFLYEASVRKSDEFYTLYESVEDELKHYNNLLKGKRILCNCNDGIESNFYKYLKNNAINLGIKKVVGISFSNSENTKAYKYTYLTIKNQEVKEELKGIGSFDSYESIQALKECDIVITNPPFSKFREWLNLVLFYNKDFIVLANMNSIAYPEVFTKIRDGKCRAGYNFNKFLIFKSPYQNEIISNINFVKSKGYDPKDGYVKVTAIAWFTSLNIDKVNSFIALKKTYRFQDYPYYENYKAINVDKVKDIPYNFTGVIGVPISFIGKYNPAQFEIIGMASQNKYKPEIVGIPIYNMLDARPSLKGKKCYARIFIKIKQPNFQK